VRSVDGTIKGIDIQQQLITTMCGKCQLQMIDTELYMLLQLKRTTEKHRVKDHFHSFRKDMFFSVSFFITFATAISKSSCVT